MTEQQLNEYSIFALREIARKAGVSSPTSKRKAQLIKEIMEITEGKMAPVASRTKQGRPPKNFGYSFIDVFNPEQSYFASNKNNISFNQDVKEFDYSQNSTAFGYVEIINANTAFLWVKNNLEFNCYFISPELVNKFNLKYGDMLNVKLGAGNERMIVKEILSVNSHSIKSYTGKRKDYLSITPCLPSKKIEFKNNNYLDLHFGESVYFYGLSNNANSEFVTDLLNNSNATKKLYLNLSIAEKNKYILDTLNCSELFVADILEGPEKAKKLILLAVERAKRLVEEGEDVVLFIDDVLSCWSLDEPEHISIKKAMSATKNTKKGSLTLFAIMSEEMPLKIFEKLADKKFNIINKEVVSR